MFNNDPVITIYRELNIILKYQLDKPLASCGYENIYEMISYLMKNIWKDFIRMCNYVSSCYALCSC